MKPKNIELMDIPLNDQGEHCVIAAMMISAAVVVPVVTQIISEEDFHEPELGKFFAMLVTLHEAGKPINDEVLLRPLIKQFCILIGESYVHRALRVLPHAGHARFYAENIRRQSRLRKLIGLGGDLQSKASEPDASETEVENWLEAQTATFGRNSAVQPMLLRDASLRVIEDLERRLDTPQKSGAMTGVFAIDEVVGPVLPGEVCILAARPGCGKTALATQAAIHAAEKGRSALICSLEMRQAELTTRILCQEAGVNSKDIRRGNFDRQTIAVMRQAAEQQENLPLRIWAPPSATLSMIRGQARFQKATTGLELLVIDYLGLVKVTGEDKRQERHLQVQAISAGVKELAKELDVPVILLSQLNRQGDNEPPQLTHLRESGAIEQDADIVLMLHHGKIDAKQRNQPHEVHVIIGKHRHGATGAVTVMFVPVETRFTARQSVPSPQNEPQSRFTEFDSFGGSDGDF